jgi:hypothetical protein
MDVLISNVPGITAAQIMDVCKKLTNRAVRHGWLERPS